MLSHYDFLILYEKVRTVCKCSEYLYVPIHMEHRTVLIQISHIRLALMLILSFCSGTKCEALELHTSLVHSSDVHAP